MIALLLELRRGGLRDPAALPAFAAGIARNIVRSEHRSSTRHDVQSLDMDVVQASDEDADVRRLDVERALDRLPVADQQVLRLILVEGCKPADLAVRLGISARRRSHAQAAGATPADGGVRFTPSVTFSRFPAT